MYSKGTVIQKFMYIQHSSLELSNQSKPNQKIIANPFYYYEIKTDHWMTLFLVIILILTPIIVMKLGYERITKLLGRYLPNQNDKDSHSEFLLLLNNLSIVNRNCIIFPMVLFVTLFLFTVKMIGKVREPDNNDNKTIFATNVTLPDGE